MKKLKLSNISAPLLLIFLAMILIVIAFLIVASTKWSDDKLITDVKISGNHYVKNKDIIDLIKAYALSQPKKFVKLDSISSIVKTNNYILSANSSYGLNGELQIEVKEREPISYIIDKSGTLQVVDEYSFIFENYSIPKNLNLPIIFLREDNFNKYSLKNTLLFIRKLFNSNTKLNSYILEFTLSRDSRIIKATDKLYNLDLLFSSKGDALIQFNKFVYFVDNYKFTNINNLSYLDLRWDNKVLLGKKI